jgi:hypothetical protein
MVKRNTDVVVKLILITILLILLTAIIKKADELEQPIPEVTSRILVQPEQPEVDTLLCKVIKWEEEYYYATNVWKFLRQRNFSQAAACGIIGNMMVETSGSTLALKPYIYSPSGNYYGLCQWSKKYYSGAFELPFEYQLDYLLGTISWEFKTFGWLYKEGFTLEDFLNLEDPAEAALAFAKVYERCGPASYGLRQQAAEVAYEYFNLDN